MLVEKSLKRACIPRLQFPPSLNLDDSEEEVDHLQWFRNAIWKMVENGVVECRDMRSLEIDIRMQYDEFLEERYNGMPYDHIPIADYVQ